MLALCGATPAFCSGLNIPRPQPRRHGMKRADFKSLLTYADHHFVQDRHLAIRGCVFRDAFGRC